MGKVAYHVCHGIQLLNISMEWGMSRIVPFFTKRWPDVPTSLDLHSAWTSLQRKANMVFTSKHFEVEKLNFTEFDSLGNRLFA